MNSCKSRTKPGHRPLTIPFGECRVAARNYQMDDAVDTHVSIGRLASTTWGGSGLSLARSPAATDAVDRPGDLRDLTGLPAISAIEVQSFYSYLNQQLLPDGVCRSRKRDGKDPNSYAQLEADTGG
jgi:hypothetical protein